MRDPRWTVHLPVMGALSVLAVLLVFLLPRFLDSAHTEMLREQLVHRATDLSAVVGEPLQRGQVRAAGEMLQAVASSDSTEFAHLAVFDENSQLVVGVRADNVRAARRGVVMRGGSMVASVPVPGTTMSLQLAVPDERVMLQRTWLAIALVIAAVLLVGGLIMAFAETRKEGMVLARPTSGPERNGDPEDSPTESASGRVLAGSGETYLAWMSHELRTPLTAIIGYSEMLEEDAVHLEQTDFIPDLKNIRKASAHLLSLVDDVVDLSRVHAGTMEVVVTELEVEEFVHEVVSDSRSLVRRTLGTLDVQVAATAGAVKVDREKLARALGNLLRQVLGLTGQGQLTLLVERVGVDGVDMLQFALTHPELRYDTELVRALLSDYTRPDQRALPQYARTGLGLVVTREFAELMGGDLLVQPAQTGSIFVLRVPAQVREFSGQ